MAGTAIHVDLHELDRFSDAVGAVTSSALAPGADRAFSVFGSGATFGRFTASFEVLAARLKYHDALVSVTTSLAGFVNASNTLVAAVDQVRARYSTVDASVATRLTGSGEVDAVVSKATADATTAAPSSAAPVTLTSDVSDEGGGSVMGDPNDWRPMACTAWGGFTVPQLWDMVKDADHGDETFVQQRAWQATSEVLTDHVTSVRRSATDLLAVWSPSSSQAAASFNRYTETLLIRMERVALDALTNAAATGGLGHALIAAKERLQPIYQEWMRNEAAQRNANVVEQAAAAVGLTDPDGWREPLVQRAAAVMVAADTGVAQSRSQLVAPQPYVSRQPDVSGDGADALGPGAAGAGNSAGTGWAQPPAITRPAAPTFAHAGADATNGSASGGAVLAGSVSAPAAPAAHVDVPTGQALSTGGVLGLLPGVVAGGLGAGRFGALGTRGGAGGALGQGELAPVRTSAGVPRQGRPVGSGGVIGGRPEPTAGAGGRGAMSPAERLGRTGGVIGAQPVAEQAGQPVGAGGTGGSRRGGSGSTRRRFDPDNPWAVEEGGPAVIEPGPEPTSHDPGPGVIGVDR